MQLIENASKKEVLMMSFEEKMKKAGYTCP